MTTWMQMLSSAFDASPPQRRVVRMPQGGVLRFDDARGAFVRVAAGRVWITEERRSYDVVLDASGSHRIASRGRAIVAAERASRVVIEWPAHAAVPRIEVADAAGERGWPLPGTAPRHAWIRAALDAWRPTAQHVAKRADPSPESVRDRLAALVPLLRA